ncbi:IclR family transcriptional regulator [Glacieibacterium sp.]|uniref:IclR family transcriptional regulator n=1 Tax=Glacieibacterium sp. TaxID=2860237 RepID=UPI003B0087DD
MKAFTLLQAFERPDEWLTCRELSRRANMPEASGYRLVQSLQATGAVIKGPNGRYRPGMLLFDLSKGVSVEDLLRTSAATVARDIATRYKVTVQMGIFEDGMVSYLAVQGRAKVPSRAGAQLEAYCSGLGKVLLASLSDADLEEFLAEGELIPLTAHTIVDKDQLRAELMRVREQGYAIDDREIQLDLRCVAVPIRNKQGAVVAAISSSSHPGALTPLRQVEVRHALHLAAEQISARVYPREDAYA